MWAQVSKQHSIRGEGLAMWSRVTVGKVDVRTVRKMPAPLRRVRKNSGTVTKRH